MGSIAGGLSSERYDRSYSDWALIRRTAGWFRVEGKRLGLVAGGILIDTCMQTIRPLLIRRGIDVVTFGPTPGAIFVLSFAILVTGALIWTFHYVQSVAMARVTADVVLNLRLDVFRAVAAHDLSFFDENASGRIVSRVTEDTQDFAQVISLTLNLVSQLLLVVPLLAILIGIQWRLAVLVLVIVPVVAWASLAMRRISRPVAVQERRMRATINATIGESIGGIAVAKSFRQERTLYETFQQVNQQAYRVGLKRGLVMENTFPVIDSLRAMAIVLILYAGGIRVIEGAISPGTWYLFIQAFELFLIPFIGIATFWSEFQGGLSAAERVFALLDVEPRVIQRAAESVGERLKGEIAFRNVSFAYHEGKDVLRDFSLVVRAGETLALVGHTGAGKSSLIRLITRFYEFQGGQILVDNRDIRTFDLPTYRRQIGLVPQQPFLFSGTLLDNIRYGCPEADEPAVLAAARRIGGGDWLDDLPDGLHTDVGERGATLSLGQRQLVALARVLINNPTILLLDEATASVDPFTEAQIQEGLEEVFRDRTSIVIAHRLSTVERADRIVVLEEGAIIEEGTHDALLAAGGHYATLYDAHFRHQAGDYRAPLF